MPSRLVLFLLACLFATGPAFAADPAPVRYTLRFTAASTHYLDIEAEVPVEGRTEVTLFMPVWTPGSYLVREYARHIVDLRAFAADGTALPVEKSAKNRWIIPAAGHERIVVRYRLFAREVNVRGNWIERDFAMLNGAPTFLTLAENYQRPYHVRLELPAGWQGSYTPLTPAGAPNTYTAPDFDTLVDSPILAGSPQVDSFTVDGVPHTLVTLGGDGVWDNARVARNLARVVEAQRSFWGALPYRDPYIFFNLLTGSRGGLEHKHSFVITADRWLSRTRGGIASWLSLASHEFFHVWNGKRLRPAELGPFAYEHEVYTKSLWIVEGITSYYQHLLLHRAGFNGRDDYLGNISSLIAGVQKTPGRLAQSLSDASYDAWIKAYRPDENSVNAMFSYYSGGALAAALLDAEIRRVSDGAKSLDDVMRAAFARYSNQRGYTEGEFIALTSEIAGQDLSDWFHRVVQTPGQWDYQPLLDWYGLAFQPAPTPGRPSPNGLEPADPLPGFLGADTRARDDGRLVVSRVRDGTPASVAGLYVDDEIIALNGYRVSPDQFGDRLSLYAAGDQVNLLVSRRDQLITLAITLAAPPRETWSVYVRPDATPAQTAHLEAWLSPAALPPGS